MRILTAGLRKYRNEEIFQFFTEFKELVDTYNIDQEILGDYRRFLFLLEQLDIVLIQVQKSFHTVEISKLDTQRDSLVVGLKNAIKGNLSHYEEQIQKAARKLMILFEGYGDIRKKNYAQETAGIYNLIVDLNEKCSEELETLNLQGWVDKISECNNNFQDLIMQRDKEKSQMPRINTVALRKELEEVYGEMVRRIEATTLLNPKHTLKPFVDELNTKIERYKQIISVRHGKSAARKKRESDSTTEKTENNEV